MAANRGDQLSDATPAAQADSESSQLGGITEILSLDQTIATPTVDPLLGKKLGDVLITRLIAEGGMGRVYEGLQEKPKRPVAVKVMRPGIVSHEVRRRFDNEAEVLGKLRHPYIAQIYSAGLCSVVGATVPFFVMEYVADAMPITTYANHWGLSIRDRLELFRKACQAVAHGHDNGVLHRDLKPSNILVDPGGLPKVIDFGIARNVDAAGDQLTALTEVGQLVGTVQYMSPEQFTDDSRQIDLRSDVYALGIILYELLTGKPPYEINRKQIFQAAELVGRHRPVSPSRLNKALQPDVDAVTCRCLEKDRRNRYRTAGELASALDRFLNSAPTDMEPIRQGVGRLANRFKSFFSAAAILSGFVVVVSAVSFIALSRRTPVPQAPKPQRPNFAGSRPINPKQVKGQPLAKLTNSIGMTLIRVPAGTFRMGSPISEIGRKEDENQVDVELGKSFFMSATEVTQAQWYQVMNNAPWMNGDVPHPWVKAGDNYPACHIDWAQAKAFCERLTQIERKQGLISAEETYALPTEAQWEYACRAGTQTPFGCGRDIGELPDYAWFADTTLNSRHCQEVGTRKPNRWGFHDMHGNVYEWCSDFYSDKLTGGLDPTGPSTGRQIIRRSSGWDCYGIDSRSARRWETDVHYSAFNVGLRVVRTIGEVKQAQE
jgi:serine/threonine protein kinase